jgi:hypothetical protein
MHISVSYSNVFPRAKELHILGASSRTSARVRLVRHGCICLLLAAHAPQFSTKLKPKHSASSFMSTLKCEAGIRTTSTARSKEGGADHVRFSDPETGKVATFVGGD